MKKMFYTKLLLIILILSFASACTKADASTPKESVDVITDDNGSSSEDTEEIKKDEPQNQGITVNKIDFTIVDAATVSEEQKKDIENLQRNKGYKYWAQEDGSYLVLICAGEKSTDGYSISVDSIEDNEGKTNITVTENEPSGDMQNQVLTYPYTLIQAAGITDNFNIHDQNGNEYLLIE